MKLTRPKNNAIEKRLQHYVRYFRSTYRFFDKLAGCFETTKQIGLIGPSASTRAADVSFCSCWVLACWHHTYGTLQAALGLNSKIKICPDADRFFKKMSIITNSSVVSYRESGLACHLPRKPFSLCHEIITCFILVSCMPRSYISRNRPTLQSLDLDGIKQREGRDLTSPINIYLSSLAYNNTH